jgi:hypothetical protein
MSVRVARDGPRDRSDEIAIAERLGDGRRTGVNRRIARRGATIAGDENDRYLGAAQPNPLSQLEPVQSGKAKIDDEAVRVWRLVFVLLRGCEDTDLVPHRAQEPPKRGAHGFIVVDDGEPQRFCVGHGVTGVSPPDAGHWQRVGRLEQGRRP